MPPELVIRTSLQQVLGLLTCLVLTFAAAALGGIASAQAGAFYASLARPAWAPPGWLFAPVWTVLYLLMAIASWLVWRTAYANITKAALSLFVVQLAANALWTWLFFAWRLGGPAFLEILVLWCLIALTMRAFWQLNRLASLLLAPYLAWVTFASALTWATWRMNPVVLG